jgi:hypothetical protein
MIISLERPVEHQRMEIFIATLLFFFVLFFRKIMNDVDLSISYIFLCVFIFCLWFATSQFVYSYMTSI